MPQRTVDLDAVNAFLAQQQGPASMTKNAVPMNVVRDAPPAAPMPEGFTANLQQELSQGGQHIMSGANTAYNSRDIRGVEQLGGVGEAALGGMQALNAPVTAAARAAGQTAQDIVQPVAGETAGAVAGTVVDTAVQMLGGPALGRVARATAQTLARITPGFSTGSRIVRRAMLSENAQLLPSLIKPSGVDAEQIYSAINKVHTRIPVPQLEGIVNKLARTEEKVGNVAGSTLQSTPIRNIVEEMGGAITKAKGQGGLPFDELHNVMKRLNERIRAMPEQGKDELYGAYMQLKKGIYEDMENTRVLYKQGGMNKDAYTEMMRANGAWRQESAAEDLQHFVSQATRAEKGSIAFNADAVLTKIRRNEFFRESVPPETLKSITSTLEDLSRRMPSRPAPMSERAGLSAAIAGTAALVGAVSGVGPSLTAPQFMGGLTGLAGGIMAADFAIGEALKTRPGQAMLRKLFQKDALITPEKMAALTMFTRGATEYASELSKPKEQTVQVP